MCGVINMKYGWQCELLVLREEINMYELNKWLGDWQYIWFFVILLAELVVSSFTLYILIKEYYYDRGLVEKKTKPVKPKEVVLAPLPDGEKK